MTDIYESVKNANSIGITAHIKPDGDAVGSALAMYLYLKKRLPQCYIKLMLDKPAPCFDVVPNIDCIDSDYHEDRVFDVFMVLDTDRSRIGDYTGYFDNALHTINIDHHISNVNGCARENYVVPSASACAEVIFGLLDKDYIDKDIATALYIGLAHDTGVFRYSNVSPATLRAAADLLEYGFDSSMYLDKTFFEKSYKQNCAQGYIVLESKLYFDGKLIIGIADAKFMEEHGVTKDDFDGVVNQLLLTKGVESAVFMYEKKPGLFKISLRASSDLVNVAKIAEALGGGGHIRAAGVDVPGSSEMVVASVIELMKEQLS